MRNPGAERRAPREGPATLAGQEASANRADASAWLVPVALLTILCLLDVAASTELVLQPAAPPGSPLAAVANVFGLTGTAVIRILLLALCAGALVTAHRSQPASVAPLLRGAAMLYAVLLLMGVALNLVGCH